MDDVPAGWFAFVGDDGTTSFYNPITKQYANTIDEILRVDESTIFETTGESKNRWRLLKKLGNGTFGIAYEALLDGRPGWVLKLTYDIRDGKRERFVYDSVIDKISAERRRSFPARPSNPALRSGEEISKKEPMIWNAFERVDGANLNSVWGARDTLSAASAAQIAVQLIQAVKEMHKLGWSHNDINAGNVMYRSPEQDPNCGVVLMDFGLSVRIDSYDTQGTYFTRSARFLRTKSEDDKAWITTLNDVEAIFYLMLAVLDVDYETMTQYKDKDKKFEKFLHVCMEEDPSIKPFVLLVWKIRDSNLNSPTLKWSDILYDEMCEKLLQMTGAGTVIEDAYKRIDWPAFRNYVPLASSSTTTSSSSSPSSLYDPAQGEAVTPLVSTTSTPPSSETAHAFDLATRVSDTGWRGITDVNFGFDDITFFTKPGPSNVLDLYLRRTLATDRVALHYRITSFTQKLTKIFEDVPEFPRIVGLHHIIQYTDEYVSKLMVIVPWERVHEIRTSENDVRGPENNTGRTFIPSWETLIQRTTNLRELRLIYERNWDDPNSTYFRVGTKETLQILDLLKKYDRSTHVVLVRNRGTAFIFDESSKRLFAAVRANNSRVARSLAAAVVLPTVTTKTLLGGERDVADRLLSFMF